MQPCSLCAASRATHVCYAVCVAFSVWVINSAEREQPGLCVVLQRGPQTGSGMRQFCIEAEGRV